MRFAGCFVRDFLPADQSRVREIVLQGLGEHFGSIDYNLNPDLDDIVSSYLQKGHQFFVAEKGGAVVGCVGLLKEAQGLYRIVRMSVLKEVRRHGIARALLTRCVRWANENRAAEIRAYTQPEWRDAVSFYQAQGFSQYGADEIDIHLRRRLVLRP